MRVHLNIPDLLLSQIDARAELDAVDRTAVVCRLLARGLRADEAHDRHMTGPSADQAHDVGPTVQPLTQRQADVALLPELPPVPARHDPPAFGPLGGSAPSIVADLGDDMATARAAQEVLLRKRADLGLDSSGLAPEQATTRAAVQGTGPRPLGDLPAIVAKGRVRPGRAPSTTDG